MLSDGTISIVARLRSHTMATAADALAVANAATAAATTATARIIRIGYQSP